MTIEDEAAAWKAFALSCWECSAVQPEPAEDKEWFCPKCRALSERGSLVLAVKVGDLVMWEDWAGPQKIVDIYTMSQKRGDPPDAGDIQFADCSPAAPHSKNIGHSVFADELVPLEVP